MKTFLLFLLLLPSLALAESNCAGLKERECFEKLGCVLDCTSNADKYRCSPYVCRPAKGACENTYPQSELTKDKCQAMTSCVYTEPYCFCPGPMECYCGGGRPAMCREKS